MPSSQRTLTLNTQATCPHPGPQGKLEHGDIVSRPSTQGKGYSLRIRKPPWNIWVLLCSQPTVYV